MPSTNEEQPDRQRIVASLALECQLPIDEMAAIYEHARAELAAGASVTKYLHIFAVRNVLEAMGRRTRDAPSPTARVPARLEA
jgi:hypothetical protein